MSILHLFSLYLGCVTYIIEKSILTGLYIDVTLPKISYSPCVNGHGTMADWGFSERCDLICVPCHISQTGCNPCNISLSSAVGCPGNFSWWRKVKVSRAWWKIFIVLKWVWNLFWVFIPDIGTFQSVITDVHVRIFWRSYSNTS